MADKGKKRNAKISDDSILSDSDASLPDFECETCGVSYTDPKAYENHMLGKKHGKKVAEAKLRAQNEKSDKEAESEEDSDESPEMQCEICDKHFTGYVSYAAHIKGTQHAKNVKKQKLKKQLDSMPEVIKNENDEEDSDDDGILPKPYAKCSTCQKEFGGPESFKMHVKSATHLKKVKQAKAMQELKKNEGEQSDGEEVFSKCEVCKKSFSGVTPYQIHMKSNVHKKNLEKKKIAEEIKEFSSNTDFSEGYVCKECKKAFTDPLAFKCHLQNNSHEKQKAKKALSEFLNAYPEIEYVTPYDKEEGEVQSSGDEADPVYYLICKLCHFSFSGPESAQDHVKSKKHVTTKKEKKVKKLLKEKQKMSCGTSNGNTNDKQTSKKTSSDGKQINESKNGDENSIDEFELI